MHARDLPDEDVAPLTPEQIAEAQAATDARDYRSLAAASNLIAERLPGRFVILDDVGEGRIFLDDTEELSGYVLDERGDLWAFWTAWDADAGRLTLGTWERVESTDRDSESTEYRRARAQVGLAPASSRRR
jgi:hypothetical protein